MSSTDHAGSATGFIRAQADTRTHAFQTDSRQHLKAWQCGHSTDRALYAGLKQLSASCLVSLQKLAQKLAKSWQMGHPLTLSGIFVQNAVFIKQLGFLGPVLHVHGQNTRGCSAFENEPPVVAPDPQFCSPVVQSRRASPTATDFQQAFQGQWLFWFHCLEPSFRCSGMATLSGEAAGGQEQHGPSGDTIPDTDDDMPACPEEEVVPNGSEFLHGKSGELPKAISRHVMCIHSDLASMRCQGNQF